MSIGILHLTDLHLRENDSDFSLDDVFDAISIALSDAVFLLIVFSGDIVFSGKKSEYLLIEKNISNLKSKVESLKSGLKIGFVMSPGNHDCDFGSSDASRDNNVGMVLAKGIDALGKDNSVIDSCTKVQENFFNFLYKYNDSVRFEGRNKLYYKYSYSEVGINMVFNCYNTSWLSKKNEEYGGLIFPLDEKGKRLKEKTAGLSVNIAVFHHPYNWMTPKNANHKEFLNNIIKNNAVALFGHEHKEDEKIISSSNMSSGCIMMEGDVLYNDSQYGGFRYLSLNKNLVLNSKGFIYENGKGFFVENSSEEYDLTPYATNEVGFYVKDEYKCFLCDCGVVNNHPSNKKIELKSLYVYPKLRNMTSEENAFLRSKDLFKKALLGDFVILCGQDQIGKTSLLKMFFEELYREDIFPLFVDGEKDILNDNIAQLLKRMLRNQYRDGNKRYEEYLALDKKKKILLIDNFHLIKKSVNVKRFIRAMKEHFSIVLATSGLTERFDNFSGNIDGVESVKIYDIMRFGNIEREELIRKWLSFYDLNGGELLDKRVRLHEKLDDVIGKNIVPSYPVFLITILHSLEGEYSSQQEITSYGYCYQTLIYLLLRYNSVQEREVDSYFNLLTHLSYYMYDNKYTYLNDSGVYAFFEKYKEKYVFSNDQGYTIKCLLESKILQIDSMGNISFKYLYVYYYFVAKYIADYKADDDVLIGNLCGDIQNKENVFILLFLTHHTKNDKVIDEIILNTMCLYDNYDPVGLGDENSIYENEFVNEIVNIVLERIDPEVYRVQVLEEKDKMEEMILNNDQSYVNNGIKYLGQDGMNLINQYAIEFKKAAMSININGMIIKNRYGSIEKDRLMQIIEEVYMLCFRMMSCVRDFFMGDNVINMIVSAAIMDLRDSGYLGGESIPSRELIEKEVRRIMLDIIYMLNYSLMESTSYSIGSEKIISLYNSISKKNNSSIFSLLTFIIKIKSTNKLDIEELKNLKSSLRNNYLLYSILKRSVVEYLYMHYMSYKDKARIANIMGIKIQDQILMREKYSDRI